MSAPAGQSAQPASPFAGLYDFVRGHLVIANALVLASGSVVAALDFLAPRLWMLPKIVYATTAALVVAMMAAAIAPVAFGRLLALAGLSAPVGGGEPLWRRPGWQCAMAMLVGVTIVGFASVAKASQGGLISASIPAARSLQESLLGLHRDMADISVGVREANGKLDALVAASRDPQKDLAARGYGFDSNGLMKAIKQGDRHAVGLFAHAGFRTDKEGPLSVLISGGQPWDAQLAAMLPRSMFDSPEACRAGSLLQWELKAPAAERIAAFKALCDPARAVEVVQAAMARDSGQPANEQERRQRDARAFNLTELRQ